MIPIGERRSGVHRQRAFARRFLLEDAGQSGIEYAIVAALIGVAVTSGSNTLMPALRTTFAAISTPRAEVASGVGATVPTQVQVTR
jgi:Flp pilus assembly pilin Flp